MFRITKLLASAFIAILLSSHAWGQASVNESLETATVWVDAVNGSDTNPGSESQPYKTIGAGIAAAVANNQNSIGTAIMVQPGIYRESLSLTATSRDTSLPITLQAVTPGTVTVSGAVQFQGWTPWSVNPAVYTNPWTNNWGLCPTNGAAGAPPFPDITLRREILFVDGAQMTQVLTPSSLVAGTFYVDEAGGTIYLYPRAGTDLNAADVEVGNIATLATITRAQTVVRGINFQYANSCKDIPAVNITGSNANNILLDTVNISWNNSIGLNITNPATSFSVINSTANHNGQAGLGAYKVKNGYWSHDTAAFNNWRGAQGAIYNWNLGGFHPYQVHSSSIDTLNLYYNQTYGAHWDTDHRNITVNNLTSVNNLLLGDFYEKNEGPITITNGTYCGNNLATTTFASAGAGVALRDSMNITMSGTYFYNNAYAQLSLIGTPGGVNCTPTPGPECVVDWETGQPYNLNNQNLTLTNNVFWANDATQFTFSDSYLGDTGGFTDWTTFESTYVGTGNTWWNPAVTATFEIPPTAADPATQSVDLAGWQAATAQDSDAIFAQPVAPSSACLATQAAPTVPATNAPGDFVVDVPDFWLVVSNPNLALDNTGATSNTFVIQPVGSFPNDITITTDVSAIPGVTSSGAATVAGGSGTATISYSAAVGTAAGTYQIPVMATGGGVVHTGTFYLTVPPGGARVSTSQLTFGPQLANTSSAAQSVILTNTGSTPISGFSVTAVTLAGSTTVFTESDNCGPILAGGASCTLNVTFTPGYAGTFNGTLSIFNSDPSSPQTVALTGTGLAIPQLRLTPQTLYFGNVDVTLTSAAQTATFSNISTASTGTISSIVMGGANPADFTVTNSCGTSLAAGTNCTFTATFSPLASGLRTASVTITDNSSNGTHTLNLQGTGVIPLPAVSLSPSNLAFGSVDVTAASAPQTFTITNTATDPLAVENFSTFGLSGANPGDYTYTTTCGATLATGASCTVTVCFRPTVAGSRPASFQFTDNTTTGTHSVNLTGTGVVPVPTATLTPSTLAFGNLDVTLTSAPLVATLTNTATDPLAVLNINSITLVGANPGDYTYTTTCGATLATGTSCTVSVSFKPTTSGSRPATLQISDNTTTGTHSTTLTGTGVIPVPTVTVSPGTLGFGNVDVTLTSNPLNVTLTNTATDALAVLNISNLGLTGTNPGDFTYTTTCGATLAINTSCTFSVSFKPTTSGLRTANLQFSDNTATGAHVISLSGTGVVPVPSVTLSPGTLNFGNVDVTLSSNVLTATLTNTATDALAVLNISNLALVGANPGDYTYTTTCGATLAINTSCTFNVTFKPTVAGSRTATLQFSDNTTLGTHSISLTGTGIVPVPTVTVSPGTLNFGNLDVSLTSTVMTSTLTNTATDPLAVLNISGLGLTGANPGDYTYTTTCGATLAINTSCTFSVQFKPTLAGSRTATLQFTDNTTLGSHSVSLTGTGVSPTPIAKLSVTTLAFGNVNEGAPVTKMMTLTNSSTDPLALMFITSISKSSGTDSNEYTVTDNCPRSPSTLAAGGSCTVTVVFSPTNLDVTSATVTFTDNANPATQTLTLTGTGTQPVPTASLTPATLAFGNVSEGTTLPKTSTLKNTSTNSYATLSISSIAAPTGVDGAEYTVTDNCPRSPSTLAAGASCTITVVFAPVNLDVTSSTVKISDNIKAGYQNLTLTGTGTVPKATVTFTPASLTFASTKVGVTSSAQAATLSNTSTNPYASLSITSFSLTGLNPGDFSYDSSACPATLGPGESCVVNVTFTPTVKGTRKGTLNANDNGSTSKQSVTLTGTGS